MKKASQIVIVIANTAIFWYLTIYDNDILATINVLHL